MIPYRRRNVIHLTTTTDPERPRRWKTQEEVLARIKELQEQPRLRDVATTFAMNYKPCPWDPRRTATKRGMRKAQDARRRTPMPFAYKRTGT